MEMSSERLVPAAPQAVWDALNAPETLRNCIAGCEKIELIGPDQYDVGMSIKIGPVSAKFKGKMSLNDIVAPDSYSILFEGQGGMAGFAKGSAAVQLLPQENDGGTLLRYQVQAQVGGKLAQLGSRLIDSSARKMADDFFARFVALFALSPTADEVSEDAGVATLAPENDAQGKNGGGVKNLWARMTK
jgi:carbon monoxide dehydrogenase subunit G